jgi:hypothetical protein
VKRQSDDFLSIISPRQNNGRDKALPEKATMMLSLIGYLQSRMIRKKWERKGKPLPTPERIKQDIVKDYAKSFSLRTFIETGTYHGGMVHAVKRCFERIWSIELDKNLCEEARQRFRRDHHISIVQGDSGEVLPEILASVDTPSLFWLDGHYSGGDTAKGKLETPIRIELSIPRRVAEHHTDSPPLMGL